ncbi:hypothetical protein, partial [Phocaeicola sp.]|uniref:hypothetical protein n=1 Tax=Phocaeicola sp. TaxID=2773926 RepID=UPI002639D0AE
MPGKQGHEEGGLSVSEVAFCSKSVGERAFCRLLCGSGWLGRMMVMDSVKRGQSETRKIADKRIEYLAQDVMTLDTGNHETCMLVHRNMKACSPYKHALFAV